MMLNCPLKTCSNFSKKGSISKDGKYFRKNDSRWVQRFICTKCGKRLLKATSELEFRQKKRRVNNILFKLLCSGMSMRRCALVLNIHQITVKRKLIYLAKKARLSQSELLKKFETKPVMHLQFDDLITIEHTKLKPLSISIAIDVCSRAILGAVVTQIPAFGHLAELSRKKYGKKKVFTEKVCVNFLQP